MRTINRCLTVLLTLLSVPATADPSSAWEAMSQPGHAILMRHANAPGTGDPADFTLGDCSTQRNLDQTGREQARQTGARLRERGIDGRTVYTSRWCRCTETAELLDIGPVEPLDGLNSFFGDAYTRAEIMPRLRAFLREAALDPPPVLVTHQVNITALTGVFPREGELVVVAVEDDADVRVVGRIPAID
ncbi:histidine phosphatase family protein [Halofilum ochraceum]|uniref:histidine phosphatase family protein n=1 Tax=Halofilum ochraceum TaxID=1611323 RepID=UPI0008D986AD|nr:histidine phosphatase family protein [Halofilum ochraceum]